MIIGKKQNYRQSVLSLDAGGVLVGNMLTAPNIEISLTLALILLLIFTQSLFFLSQILKLYMNPASIINSPDSDGAIEDVDKFSTRSIAIFSIVLVVINFTLSSSPDQELGYWGILTVNVLTLSASFLILSFVLEMWGAVKNYLFNLQITALRYAGLLLFMGLYFLLRTEDMNSSYSFIFSVFVIIAWIMWIIHELDYIFNLEKKEWENSSFDSRSECIKKAMKGLNERIRP